MFSGRIAFGQDESLSSRIDSASTSAEEQRQKKEAAIPRCDAPVGSVTIAMPERNWWQQYQLQSPDALIKMYVAKSGCFTLVDRGRGFAIAERERALASGGNLRQGSNIGGGQMKAADFVITPDIVVNNNNSGGSAIGAILGAFLPGPIGMIAGQVRISDKSADVTLAVTDVRSSEQVVLAEGQATKTDVGFGVAGGAFMGGGFGAAGVGSYANTALGQVVALAYLDAYTKMVAKIQVLRPADVVAVEPPSAVQAPPPPLVTAEPRGKPVAVAKAGYLYDGPSAENPSIRSLSPGTILYSTSKKSGAWVEVTDDTGRKGWVFGKLLFQ
ncbi:MAG: CsgG/HfaB family protein [Candidatus Paceibacterota bacterium]|jgi:curli biogenesis system outer membrane secretion channel CsgG